MAFNRTRLIELISHKTVDTMMSCMSELEGADKQDAIDGLSDAHEGWIEEIKSVEKAEQISAAKRMFNEPDDASAIKMKRNLAKRTTEARIITAWIVAGATGSDKAACEAYRKAATMRTSIDTVERDLEALCQKAGLEVIPCETNDKGKVTKAKSTPAQVMALLNLRAARKLVREVLQLRAMRAEYQSKAG